jgi:hypothetical protein
MNKPGETKENKDKKAGVGTKPPTLEESIPPLTPLVIPDDIRTMEDMIVHK